MLFNSFEFLVFLPAIVLAYFLTPIRYRWMLLLAGSYYFYACWKVEYLVLIMGSTVVDYWLAREMQKHPDRASRRPYLIVSLIANLGLLFTFKYLDFFGQSVQAAFDTVNIFYDVPTFDLLLPVGISFYTFQTLSYSIDVYRGEQTAEKHLGIFALYVTFFPQLVAGPIERSTHLLPQFHPETESMGASKLPRGTRASSKVLEAADGTTHYSWSGIRSGFDANRAASGLKLVLWGFFKKLVIADRLAIYVNAVYAAPEEHSAAALILATYFFAFQIYCDFSGYSDIAIGTARILGFDLMENFRRPFFATSISDFWRRWHISLTTWFRDYVYIPLGGNRVSIARQQVNIMILFVVSGVWHGAGWTFVLWGAMHGFFIIFGAITSGIREKAWQKVLYAMQPRFPEVRTAGISLSPQTFRHLVSVVTAFMLFTSSAVFFRAQSLQDAMYIYANMWSFEGAFVLEGFGVGSMIISFAAIFFLLWVHFMERGSSFEVVLNKRPAWQRWAFYYILLGGILAFGVFNQDQFIYFQF